MLPWVAFRILIEILRHWPALQSVISRVHLTGTVNRCGVAGRLVVGTFELHFDRIGRFDGLEVSARLVIRFGPVEDQLVLPDRQRHLEGRKRLGGLCVGKEHALQVGREDDRGFDVGQRTDQVVDRGFGLFDDGFGDRSCENGTLPCGVVRPGHVGRVIRGFGGDGVGARREGDLLVFRLFQVAVRVVQRLGSFHVADRDLVVVAGIRERRRGAGGLLRFGRPVRRFCRLGDGSSGGRGDHLVVGDRNGQSRSDQVAHLRVVGRRIVAPSVVSGSLVLTPRQEQQQGHAGYLEKLFHMESYLGIAVDVRCRVVRLRGSVRSPGSRPW